MQGLSLRTSIRNSQPSSLLYQDKEGNQLVRGMAPEMLR